jgi:beta-lactam-binding protein with PASTA domain
VAVPSFLGITEQQVRNQLPSGVTGFFGDFRLGTITYRAIRGATAGTVIEQDPSPGTQVPRRSATAINLVIAGSGSSDGSGGKGVAPDYPVTVPNVTDRSVAEATRILRGAGLRAEVAEGDPRNGKARVYKQFPVKDTRVQRGSVVRLYIPNQID